MVMLDRLVDAVGTGGRPLFIGAAMAEQRTGEYHSEPAFVQVAGELPADGDGNRAALFGDDQGHGTR